MNKEAAWRKINEISDSALNNSSIILQLNELLTICKNCKITDDSINAKILHILGRTFWYIGDLDKGITLTIQSITLNSQNSASAKKSYLTNSYYNLGMIYSDKNDYKKSIDFFEKCIAIGNLFIESQKIVALAYTQLSNKYHQTGDYQNSIVQADKGLIISIKNKFTVEIVNASIQKIQSLLELNDIPEAERALKKLKTINKNEINYSDAGRIYSIIGRFEQATHHYIKATAAYTQAINSFIKSIKSGQASDSSSVSTAYSNNGYNYFLNGNYEKALSNYHLALLFSNQYEISARINDNIGGMFEKKSDFSTALKYYQLSIINNTLNFSDSNIYQNPQPESINQANAKEYLLSTIKDKANCWLSYYKSTKNKDYLFHALHTFSVADKMIDYMRFEHLGLQSKYYWRDNTHALYEKAIETCYLLNDPENAFYFFEKSRAALLNDKLNELNANQSLNEEDYNKEREYQLQISDLNKQIISGNKSDSLQTKLITAQEDQRRFIKYLEEKNPIYYQYKYDTSMYSLQEVIKYLVTHNQSLIEYFEGNKDTFALLASKDILEIKKK